MILHDTDKNESVSGEVAANYMVADTAGKSKATYSSFTDFLRDYLFQKEYNKADTINFNEFRKSLEDRILLGENAKVELSEANSTQNPEDEKEHLALAQEYKQKLKVMDAEALKNDSARIETASTEANRIDEILNLQGAWSKIESSVSHFHLSNIRDFFRGLGIDVSVLKCGRGYYYTRDVVVLFRWILDVPTDIRTQYRDGEFARIPFREAHEVYLKVIAAIESIPDSASSTKEKKAEQINKLTEFLTKKYHGWDIREYHPQNSVLDAILNSVWFFSMGQRWAEKYMDFESAQDDRDWQCIVDCVYMDLLTKEVVSKQANDSSTGASKVTLQLSNALPNRYKSMKIKQYWESTEVNPNDVPRKETLIHKAVHPEHDKGKKHNKR